MVNPGYGMDGQARAGWRANQTARRAFSWNFPITQVVRTVPA
jgi:hypothetical protein